MGKMKRSTVARKLASYGDNKAKAKRLRKMHKEAKKLQKKHPKTAYKKLLSRASKKIK